jgi:hypothetical protein
MAYVPENAEWYWAEVIAEITIDGDDRNVLHRNIFLIQANSPNEAYEKALLLGKEHESSYRNPQGGIVRTRFHGLVDLGVIYDNLEHGAELFYKEDIAVSPEQIQKWVRPKDQLSLFRAEERSDIQARPDYRSGEIVDEARKLTESDSERLE